jgi:adenylate kinase family enzyme
MEIFIIGMPGSGRTTVAKALCQQEGFRYVDSISWVKATFRDQKPGEHPDQYQDAYHHWFTNRLKEDPFLGTDNVFDSIAAYKKSEGQESHYIIDGVMSPKDFTELFDYNTDMVVFLNRTDNETSHKDYESIGVSVIRDYCFWLSAAELLPKERWFEYNFKMNAPPGDFVKAMGSKNSVFVVKSISNVIDHLSNALKTYSDSPGK